MQCLEGSIEERNGILTQRCFKGSRDRKKLSSPSPQLNERRKDIAYKYHVLNIHFLYLFLYCGKFSFPLNFALIWAFSCFYTKNGIKHMTQICMAVSQIIYLPFHLSLESAVLPYKISSNFWQRTYNPRQNGKTWPLPIYICRTVQI